MREQLAHRDLFFAVASKLRQVADHRIVQPHLPKLHHAHDRGRGGNGFSKRRQVKDRIQGHGLAPRLQSAGAEGAAVYDLTFVSHKHDCAGDLPRCNRLLADVIHGGKAGIVALAFVAPCNPSEKEEDGEAKRSTSFVHKVSGLL